MERTFQAGIAMALTATLLGAACSNEDVPGKGRTLPRPGLCRVTASNVAGGKPPALGVPTTDPNFTLETCASDLASGDPSGTPCACDDYVTKYNGYPPPPEDLMSVPAPFSGGVDDGLTTGVFDTHQTRFCHNENNDPNDCVTGQQIVGCTNDFADGEVIFAWPDCASIGQVTGTVYAPGSYSADSLFDPGNDDDFTVNICPEEMSVRMPNGTWMPKDLREARNFEGLGGTPGETGPIGRMHVEVQGCRFYNGTYQILDPGTQNARSYPSRPQPGDLLTAAGDWVFDRFHELEDGTTGGWDELHESRIVATARKAPVPADGSISYLFVSTTFVNGSGQADTLQIQARAPSPGPNWVLSTCDIGANIPGVVKQPIAECTDFPSNNVTVTPRPDIGACEVTVTKDNLSLGDVHRTFHDYNCEDTCDGNDFHEDPITIPSNSPNPAVIPSDCDQLGYVGVIRATWTQLQAAPPPPPTPPSDGTAGGDLWMCNNCSCADPSSSTPLTVPVIGCAVAGLDPTSASDQATACQQACGGLVCTAEQSCKTGLCQAPASGTSASARVVGRSACVPGVPGELYRTTSAADYHVTLTPLDPNSGQGSYATFTVGSSTASQVPVNGQLSMNVGHTFDMRSNATVTILDLANLEVTPNDFNLGKNVSGAKVFVGQRLWAKFTDATTFGFPPQSVILGVRGLLDGTATGINEENETPAIGTFNPTTRQFTLDVSAQDVDASNQQRSMVAHLVGTIDNVPPTAVITGATSPLECGTPETLSAGSSTDPDGTGITRFQWLINGAPGGTQDHLSVLNKKLGKTDYDLRVYDGSLASSHAHTQINVVDTTPPALVLPPNVTTHICQTSGAIQIGQATATDACVTPVVTGAVVSLNNVTLSPAIPIVNGQATLGIGTYKVQWTASDGTNQSQGTQTVTIGGGIETSQSFLVDDRASVRTAAAAPAAVLNAGAGETRIGNDSVSGNIVSVGHVDVLDRAHVGSITSGTTVTASSTAVVGGPIVQSAKVTLPALPALPTFPTAQPGFTVNAGQTKTLSPGSYGAVILNSQATLVLAAGDYYFHDFTVNSASAIIHVVPTTRVFVQATMAFRAPFTLTNGTLQAITLGFGGSSVVMEAAFNGTLIAPNAGVTFGVGSGLTFTGSFFGKTFEVEPQSTLQCQ